MGKPSRANLGNYLTEYIGEIERTQGSEPSQYLKEKKETSIPIVVASELGRAQTRSISVFRGL
jgi:hypothetical protein